MARRGTISVAVFAAALLGGCGEGYEAGNGGAADPDVTVLPKTDPSTPGRWQPDTAAGAAALRFDGPAGAPLFRLACDDRGGMLLDRIGVETAPKIERMEVIAGDLTASLAVNPLETSPQVLRAAVLFNHELMVPLAQKEGLLTIRTGDGPALALPLGEETAALAQRCMQPDAASRADA